MKKRYFILFICLLFGAAAPLIAQDSTAEAYFKKGDYFYRNADYALAVEEFNKTLELDGNHINALLQRGFCKNITKDYEGAIADFTKVISLKPDHRWAYTSRGSARNKTGEFAAAIEDFNKTLELDPTDQEAYNNRGFSKKLSGDKKGACEDWNTSKKLGNDEAKIILKNNNCK
ncbi:MAG: tetratricopeptide repeat protein [Bacteroidetes bacterium]|nr:tetratricopeptide repeat protein [Bacteroidota bacterium]